MSEYSVFEIPFCMKDLICSLKFYAWNLLYETTRIFYVTIGFITNDNWMANAIFWLSII